MTECDRQRVPLSEYTADNFERVSIEVRARGTDGLLCVTKEGLQITSQGTTETIPLDLDVLAFAAFQMQHSNTPFLSSHMEDVVRNGTEEFDANQLYKKLIRSFGTNKVRDIFIKIGRGSATWYGMLTDDTDPELFIRRGRAIINSDRVTNERRLTQRHRVFDAMEDYYSSREHHTFSKKKIVGLGTALLLCVGGSVIYTHRVHRQK